MDVIKDWLGKVWFLALLLLGGVVLFWAALCFPFAVYEEDWLSALITGVLAYGAWSFAQQYWLKFKVPLKKVEKD